MTTKRAIAYSIDLLLPGFYLWIGSFGIRIGGSTPDDTPYKYPGVIHSFSGVALVLPGGSVVTTYRGSFDPSKNSLQTPKTSKN